MPTYREVAEQHLQWANNTTDPVERANLINTALINSNFALLEAVQQLNGDMLVYMR